MTSKWSFDKKFIEDVISKGYVLLNDPKIPKQNKKYIRTDIQTFTRFLNDDFELRPTTITKPPHDVERLKNYILKRMKYQYHNLGKDLILWTMDLGYQDIFKPKTRGKKTTLSLDEQIELTEETYVNNTPRYSKVAKSILSNDIIKQIQEVKGYQNTSYCYHDEITSLPYLIINPKDSPWVTCHETQHAVEELRKLEGHKLYEELGPIFMELLFNETLYKNQGFLNPGDYKVRTFDIEEELIVLFNYYDIMLMFAEMNFDVPTDVFLKEFQDICEDETPEGLISFFKRRNCIN